jgi:hypothetical protein
VAFGTRLKKIGDGSGKFDNFHPFSVAQSEGGFPESTLILEIVH